MFKTAIAPIQAWLMSQGRCVGCGKYLSSMKTLKHRLGEKVTCTCGRMYIKKGGHYRRALLSELK